MNPAQPSASPPALVLTQFEPAFDVLAYCAFAGAPLAKLVVENSRHPTLAASADGQLPVLRHGAMIVPREDILGHLAKCFSDLDAGLSQESLAQVQAFSALLKGDLQLALDVARYDDEEHWAKSTRPMLLSALPWPFNRPVSRFLRYRALARIRARVQLSSPRDRLEWARRRARRALQALTQRLGATSNWVLGTHGPTSLDAQLWGFLAQACSEPLVDVCNEFPLLEAYYRRGVARIARCKFVYVGGENLFVMGAGGPFLSMRPGLLPTAASRISSSSSSDAKPAPVVRAESEEDRAFKQATREAGMFAFGAVALYLLVFGGIQIKIVDGSEPSGHAEE
jgi:glutathione S-transferase